MHPVALLNVSILAPVLFGLLGMLPPRRAIGLRTMLSLLGPVLSVGALVTFLVRFGLDQPVEAATWLPAFRLDWDLHADRLGMFFALLVSVVGLLITLYARAYFGRDADSLYRFFPALHLFMTAMMGLVLSDSFMLLLLFWELTSISSFLLIGWDREDANAVKNALQAFVVTGAGGLVLMGGLIMLGLISGAWSFSELDVKGASPLVIAAFALILVGAAAKSAQWPLHFWLPGAMAAPTPVSAYLHSATMVKAGVYLIGRLWEPLSSVLPQWGWLIAGFGTMTMLVGSYVALRKSDLKQIFAYTTVSQLGLLMTMYGLGSLEYHGQPNLIWDITQILNHALYKAPLFLMAGAIAHVAHTRELPELRGLFHHGPHSRLFSVILILALYAMAAGPLTVSFTAKEFFLYQVVHGWEATGHDAFYGLMAAGVVLGAINVAIFIRMTRVLLGSRQAQPPVPPTPPGRDAHGQHDYRAPLAATEAETHDHEYAEHETGFWPGMLWVPALVMVSFQYICGLVPGAYALLFGSIERSPIYFEHFPMTWQMHAGLPLYLSLTSFGLGIVLGFLPVLRSTIRDIHDALFPAFYALSTRGGGFVFGLLQTGNLRTYLAIMFGVLVLLVLWGMNFRPLLDPTSIRIPPDALFESTKDLMAGYLVTLLVCLSAILMPLVRERASRVVVLGMVGFSVTAVYYLYGAPDLALTQISIEIVSLLLFLLVLSLLPRTQLQPRSHRLLRLSVSIAVGLCMFWLALVASTGERPAMPYVGRDNEPIGSLGEFFVRNSYESADVPDRMGGGGFNVVNVILVDFRGFDTLGEITVLALAALGVWTLLRRRRRDPSTHALRRNLSEDPSHRLRPQPDLVLQEVRP